MKLATTFWVQNDDHPELNDESVVEWCDGVLTVSCNDDKKSYRVSGPTPTQEQLDALKELHDDNPVCPDDPRFVLECLGLTSEGETELPADSGLRSPWT